VRLTYSFVASGVPGNTHSASASDGEWRPVSDDEGIRKLVFVCTTLSLHCPNLVNQDLDAGCWLPSTDCRRWSDSYTLPVRRPTDGPVALDPCTKIATKTSFRLPGLFLMYCPHGVCLGYARETCSCSGLAI